MDSDTSLYEKLIAQTKSNDVDVKVDALSKLQTYFEKGTHEIPDPEALVNILKSSLRTSNLHLTNATLSALPAILPSLITRPTHVAQSPSHPNLNTSSSTSSVSRSGGFDHATLRSALISFLPTGGVVDRLGDKEKPQVKARETLVLLGGYAFRASSGSAMSSKSSKGQEAPIALFERVLKESGLASKVWKVREQSILTLVHIRRAHHLFPIRPYLTLLVDCLEDTDPHVRDTTRLSVVELFTGPAVTDAARADLKKEMTKKGVRKTIVDGVLAKLLSGTSAIGNSESREGSENGDAKKDYIPPSLALQGKRQRIASQPNPVMARTVSQSNAREIPRPASRAAMSSPTPTQTPSADNADIQPVYIASSRDLENEFAAMQKSFEGKETEHNWAAREQAVQRVRGMLKGDVHNRFAEPFLVALKEGFIQWSLKTLASLRTTVAVNTCLLYSELAMAIGHLLDSHCEVLYTNLLKMAGFTKKITAQQSQSSVTTIITYTSAQPRTIIPLLWVTMQEKIVQARAFVVSHIKHYLELHGQRSKNAIETSNMLETLEKLLRKALSDPTPAVRESARVLFWVFTNIWQERGVVIMDTLDATARKQLERACPNQEALSPLPPTTPKPSKKSSVAAAIAASRAKAKAIATAPPSLRHQATSTSYVTAPRRAGSPNVSPKAAYGRPDSPQRISTSPSSPSQQRVTSLGIMRSSSAGAISGSSNSHVRTPSDGSDKAVRAASPSLSDSIARRRLSSPLTGSTIRKAIATPLPVSPPSSVGQQSPTPRAPPANRKGLVAPPPQRQSLAQLPANDDESLLMAQTVPIPEDSDSENDGSTNLMSFSAPFEMFQKHGGQPRTHSRTLSPASESRPAESVSNALSSGSVSDLASSQQLVVEDALRARAEQAESAAERLLELVEPEDEITLRSTLPPSLLKSTNGHSNMTPKAKLKPIPLPINKPKAVPETPNNRANMILRQAALFADSPAQKNSKSASLLDVLQDQKQETGWWLKRKTVLAQAGIMSAHAASERVESLERAISALESGEAGVETLKQLALTCLENTARDLLSSPLSPDVGLPSSPTPLSALRPLPSLHADIWEKNRTFDRFFKALLSYLQFTRSEDELAYGLVVAWEVLENQSLYLEGKEGDLFSMILGVRYCNKITVLEGTNAIRDALTTKLDPVYGLTTIHASLRVFHLAAPPSPDEEEVKAATYAFGLMALGKFVVRLPAEIAEEELPRLKATLITSLNDRSSLIVRESAAACIIAAQLVLRDETHLFTLLDGLADEKKNLLTYLFDKHGARSVGSTNGQNGMDKLEREMRRLDNRTSTPLRGGL